MKCSTPFDVFTAHEQKLNRFCYPDWIVSVGYFLSQQHWFASCEINLIIAPIEASIATFTLYNMVDPDNEEVKFYN